MPRKEKKKLQKKKKKKLQKKKKKKKEQPWMRDGVLGMRDGALVLVTFPARRRRRIKKTRRGVVRGGSAR